MSKRLLMFKKMFLYTAYVTLVISIVLGGYKVESYKVYNSSGSKYLTSFHLAKNNIEVSQVANTVVAPVVAPIATAPVAVSTMADVALRAKAGQVTFKGTMTGYGPDCLGCSGIVACSPRRDVRGGNIYVDHQTYGRMRIVAADRRVPCGSVVQVAGVRGSEPFYAIVLDRGGAIKETLFDLLFNSDAEAKYFGRQTVTYKTVRWGW